MLRSIRASFLIGAVFLSSLSWADITHVQTLIDQGKYAEAAQEARGIMESGSAGDKSHVAPLLLRALSGIGNHQDVEESFPQCLEVTSSNEADKSLCYFERAKSTEKNLKDKSQALNQYNEILSLFPSQMFSASGSLHQKGGIELSQNAPENAKTSFQGLLSRYQESPFADDAYAGLAKTEAALLNPQGIAEAVKNLEEKFTSSPVLSQAVLTQADFAYGTSGDKIEALKSYQKMVRLNPNSVGAINAQTRLADLAFERDFREAMRLYSAVLTDHPKLSVATRDWVNSQIGLCYWQFDNPSAALQYFNEVSTTSLVKTGARETAQLHKMAFENPESIERLLALYDRGLRWRTTHTCIDLCWKDFVKVKELSKKPFFEAYFTQSELNKEERAQMRYRMALVEFMVGAHDDVDGYLEKATDLNPEGITKYMAMYMEGFHHGHCGHDEHAASVFKQIIDERPTNNYLIPKTYIMLIHAYEKMDDKLGALLTAEEFKIIYPYRVEVKYFDTLQKQILEKSPDLAGEFGSKKSQLVDKLKSLPKQHHLIADEVPSGSKQLTYLGREDQ